MAKLSQQAIRECLRDFNFEKVHKYMKDTNWKWVNDEGNESVPTITELYQTAEDLLNKLNDEELTCISTGGFTVVRYGNDVELLFSIVTSSTCE